MLTAGIPRLYTAKIFHPEIQVGGASPVKFNLAAIRRNGITANNILSPGDTFVELKIKGPGGDYYIPMDLWDLFQLLTQCGKPSGVLHVGASGVDVMERLQKVGVSLARCEAWRLTKTIPFWPKSDLIQACLTHRSQLLERAGEFLNENFYNLSFVDLTANIPGGLNKATFRFNQNQAAWSDQVDQRGSVPTIKIDYEMEPVSVKTEEMVFA